MTETRPNALNDDQTLASAIAKVLANREAAKATDTAE